MFGNDYKSQYIDGQKEKFVRLDDLDSNMSTPYRTRKMRMKMKKMRFNLGHLATRLGIEKGSGGLLTFGRSLGSGVTRAVFPEELKVAEKMIFNPQDKKLTKWYKVFELICIASISCDPLFFYLPIFNKFYCIGIDTSLAFTAVTLRTVFDSIYILRMVFQFRTAFIAPSSRVFGRGELVIDPAQIASRYLSRYFMIDFISVLPMPQIIVWKFLKRRKGSELLATKTSLLTVIILQYIPRFARFYPLSSDIKKSAGGMSDNALLGALHDVLWLILASHITGSVWYLLAIERCTTCWQLACHSSPQCDMNFLVCGNKRLAGYDVWSRISGKILKERCAINEDDISAYDYGIFSQAIKTGIVATRDFFTKLCYCLWWGLQNLSTLGQGLTTSTYPGEILFSIAISITGLILFALLIGNIQTYLQSMTVRLDEMRIKRHDSEQWMHHRLLPQELRDKVRQYNQYKWMQTRGVDEENLVQNLPKDLRRDIKRHLCLNLVRRVPLFANMDERLLDAICERLKPTLYPESVYVVREGDPVNEMLFIIRGKLESVTTDGGRSGFFNRGILKEGDFCGDELLTWALDPKSSSNLPSSTRTVMAISEVEAFALEAEELKFVASQFRRLHSRQVQQTFRFYSQQWRTWAARLIQSAWRRYSKRKIAEMRRREEEEEWEEEEEEEEDAPVYESDDEKRPLVAASVTASGSGLGSAMYASRFAASAQKPHTTSSKSLGKIQKPQEPDFSEYYGE
ncbi:hypothetical protein L6164_007412 [Bauhinia variegata]|uniref:Uncharacterized protein n=1 Tax=Bauhinia variegata TaxID=167791 RepID=A0ACB9PDH9_BAUVA|nr:hypothetical protein L6164_007412 [Bauhinia variegata]